MFNTVLFTLALPLLARAVPTPHAQPLLLVGRHQAQHVDQIPSCAISLGTYGSVSGSDTIYLTDDKCMENGLSSLTESMIEGSVLPLERKHMDGHHLFWLGEAGVQGKIFTQGATSPLEDVFENMMERFNPIQSAAWNQVSDNQKVLKHGQKHWQGSSQKELELLYRSQVSLVFSAPDSLVPFLDTLIPGHLSLVGLPILDHIIHREKSVGGVRKDLRDNLANLTRSLKFDAEIDRILTLGMDERQLVRDIRYLTGESSDLVSRHSFTSSAKKAAEWIKTKVQATGAECVEQPFLVGFSPNVICTYPGTIPNATDLTVISAHYDSRGSFGSIRGPGGDDDGSGTGHLLGISQAIATQQVRFQTPVVLAFFAGEEQGLLGSHAYAKQLSEQKATVLLQVQADMLAYRVANEPKQLGLPASIETPEASWLIGNLSQIYSPELVVGRTSACCSDHQSFLAYDFPATQVFERNDWIADPEYHSSGDVSLRDNYDFDQISAISRVVFAAVLTVAGYEVEAMA